MQAPPPDVYQPAAWVSYGGGEAIFLAIVLLVVAGGFAYAGKRLRAPLRITRPGGTVAGFMIAIWLLALYTVNVVWLVYGLQLKQAYPSFVAPRLHRVGTFVIDAPVTFLVILLPHTALGLEGRPGQCRNRHCRLADDLRVSLRSDRDDAE